MHEPLDAQTILAGLKTRWLGREVHYYPVIGSMNDEARRLAAQGALDGTLVIADEQTAGRGRMSRRWIAAPGSSLLFTLLLRPTLAAAQVGRLTMLCGLAAADACRDVAGVEPSLKWPNDLLLNDRKVAGILTEMASVGERVDFLIVGMGINVSGHPADLLTRCEAGPFSMSAALAQDATLSELGTQATSLEAEAGWRVSRRRLLCRFLELLEGRYKRLLAGESPYQEWSKRLGILGRPAKIVTAFEELRGRVLGVDPDGALVVERSNGEVVHVLAGDLSLE
jgi:BirA family transcriptional regulator, biotin operon repressor / biotin---[acetyl-CoA-carboxylase] ligase